MSSPLRVMAVAALAITTVAQHRMAASTQVAAPKSYFVHQLGSYFPRNGEPSSGYLPIALNNVGDVLGREYAWPKVGTAALWRNGSWTSLGDGPGAPSGGILPLALNDSDQIVASVAGTGRYVVLTPTEPAADWLTLPANPAAVPVAIAASGVVAGNSSAGAVVWLPGKSGYSERRIPAEHVTAADEQGRFVGWQAPSGDPKLSLARVYRSDGRGYLLDPSAFHPVPAPGCKRVQEYDERPVAAADMAGASGATLVTAVGAAVTKSSGCASGKPVTTTVSTLWQVGLQNGHVVSAANPLTIATSSGACSAVYDVNSSGQVTARCQGQPAVWANGKATTLGTILSRTEPAQPDRSPFGLNPQPLVNDLGQVVTSTSEITGSGPPGEPFARLSPSSNPVGTLFTDAFDRQATGSLITGPMPNQWTFVQSPQAMTVESTYRDTAPNALAVSVGITPSTYARKEYEQTFGSHRLSFSMVLGSDFALTSSGYAAVSSTENGHTSGNVGLVELVITSSMQLVLTYIDTAGVQHYLYSGITVAPETPYSIEYDEQTGNSGGTLSLAVNGQVVVGAQNLSFDPEGVELFKVGDVYTPAGTGSGTIYFDDVVAKTG